MKVFSDGSAMENDTIAKRIYAGECAVSCSVGRPQKRWSDTMEKRGLGVWQARRMTPDRSIWWGLGGGMHMALPGE